MSEWDHKYRLLKEGEVIQLGDQCDMCRDGWRDEPVWGDVPEHMIGRKAPDPSYPAHTWYRRLKELSR